MLQCLSFLVFFLAISVSRAVVSIVGRQIRIDDVPFHVKGVNWNPVAKGRMHPQDLDFSGYVEQDAQLMADAGINAVRTYEPLTDVGVLDQLWNHGIYVISTVYPVGSADASTAVSHVNAVKDHPAILMWAVGNEWNYNGLYVGLSLDDSKAQIRDVAAIIKQHDTSHPVTTIYGELPDTDTVSSLQNIDVWGLNVYRGIGFGNLFEDWAARSGKPMYLGEYGTDAYDSRINQENEDAQAEATTRLTYLIVAQSSVHNGGICAGGLIFEFADEWWKDSMGSPSTHDVNGIAPGGGPYPDSTFNEEWWGLLDVDRQPRKAYTAYASVPTPSFENNFTVLIPDPGSNRSCEDVMNEDANGFTCGARIRYMKNDMGMSQEQAVDAISEEFPIICGVCLNRESNTTKTCEDIWHNDAAGFSCGGRAEWLMQNRDMDEMHAKDVVASEFPFECGACRLPFPTSTPTPRDASTIIETYTSTLTPSVTVTWSSFETSARDPHTIATETTTKPLIEVATGTSTSVTSPKTAGKRCSSMELELSPGVGTNCAAIMEDIQGCSVICGHGFRSVGEFICFAGKFVGGSKCVVEGEETLFVRKIVGVFKIILDVSSIMSRDKVKLALKQGISEALNVVVEDIVRLVVEEVASRRLRSAQSQMYEVIYEVMTPPLKSPEVLAQRAADMLIINSSEFQILRESLVAQSEISAIRSIVSNGAVRIIEDEISLAPTLATTSIVAHVKDSSRCRRSEIGLVVLLSMLGIS